MRLTSTLIVAMVFSVCIAGCASRRCCKCCCHPVTQQVCEETVVTEEPEVTQEPDFSEDFQVTTEPEPAPQMPEPAPQMPASVLVKISDESLRSDVPSPLILPNAILEHPKQPQIESNMLEPLLDVADVEPQPKPPAKIEPKIESRSDMYGHADDYSWLKGRLHKVHVPGVEWKIRYLPIDEVDQWGGSMVLAPDIRLEDFNHLDVVYIKGKQLADRPSLYVSGPLYRIESIHDLSPIDQ